MAGGPDLFVVCKNCRAEVSPYITECPYCGHRLRKRAPKLERGAVPKAPRRRPLSPGPRVRRSRPERAARIPTGRPYATLAIVLASILVTLAARAGLVDVADFVVGFDDDPWRAVTSLFMYFGTGYELVALACAFLFGWLLERRHGFWAPLLVFLAGGTLALYVAQQVDPGVISSGANGGALALLAAWAVRDLLDRRAGVEVDSDGLGVLLLAVLLIMVPVAAEEAHPLAGVAGGIAGLILGLPLSRLRER